jgi:hypothetical protein
MGFRVPRPGDNVQTSLPWRIALYSLTTAIAGAWFIVQNATTVCALCQDHLHFGFPFPYIDIGWAVANRHALLWPGAVADAAFVILAGFISAKGILSVLLFTAGRHYPRPR